MVEVASSRGRLKQPGSQHLQYRPRKLPQINMASCLHPLSRSRRNAVPGEAHQKAEAPRATTDHSQFTLLSCQSCWRSDREESLGQAHDHVQCVPK